MTTYRSISVCCVRQALIWAACTLSLVGVNAKAGMVLIGTLSYDTFIPGGSGLPGVDAFNVSNLTGSFSLPPDFPVTDDLTFASATLTLTLSDLSQEVLPLGDIGPGFLLDSFGNPVVQVPDNESFVFAELTATLSSPTFALSDGTSFTADSRAIDVLLVASSGLTLVPDVDQTLIPVAPQVTITMPEVSSVGLAAPGLLALIWSLRRRHRSAKRTGRS